MINHKKLSITLFSLLAVFSVSVFAGPYVTGQAGVAGIGENNNLYKNIFSSEKNTHGATGRLGVGYLGNINDDVKLGLETGYQLYQEVGHKKENKSRRHSFDVLGVADYGLGEDVNLFAKAGAAVTHGTTLPKGVIGVGYNVSKQVNLNLSLSQEFKKGETPAASSILGGISYHFS